MPSKTHFEFQVLSKKLTEFREIHGLTYQEIGDATGVDKSHIHRVLNMETFPSFKFLIQLAHSMHIPLFSLFVPTEEMLREHFCSRIQLRMDEWNWDVNTLSDRTGIPFLRLVELLTQKASPSCKEEDILHQTLHLEPILELDVASSVDLIRMVMTALGCSDEQKENVVTYIQNQIK